MSSRLSLAADAGVLSSARVLLVSPPSEIDLNLFQTAEITVVQDLMPDAAVWRSRGVHVEQAIPQENFDLSVVFLPRAKVAARDKIARSAAVSDRVIVDGQKTDGVESVLKDIRKRGPVDAVFSKSHGKLFCFDANDSLADWIVEPSLIEGRWHIAPGVFSADGVDPGSRILANALPETLTGRFADLGAGWGYLSAMLLAKAEGIKEIHLVEAQAAALDCARRNATDPRARFHWADATEWNGDTGLDGVIMNPPFHTGRAKDTDLGRAFITAAARIMRPGGTLWMVANRHLAYEQVLRDVFAEVAEIGGNNRYKVIRAKLRARQKP